MGDVLMRVRGTDAFLGAITAVTLAPLLVIPVLESSNLQLPGMGYLTALTGMGHVASSFYFYADQAFHPIIGRERWRFFGVPLLLAAGFGLIGYLTPAVWNFVYLAFFCWQLHHYQRQNFGVIGFFARATQVPRVPREILIPLNLAVVAGILGVAANSHILTGLFWAAQMPPSAEALLREAAMAFYAAALLGLAWVLFRCGELRRSPSVAIAVAAATMFFLPALIPGDELVFFWTYAIAHGAQYLIFMGVTAWHAPKRWLSLAVLGCVTSAGLVFLQRLGAHTEAYFGFVCGHFLMDAKLWRLREMPQRAILGARFGFILGRGAPATLREAA